MSSILDMREKRARAWDTAKKFLDTARDDNGLVSVENAAKYERMEADIINLGKEIERMERQQRIDSELNAPINTPIVNNPNEVAQPRLTAEYSRDFISAMRGRGVSNLLQESIDADGGYLVPVEFEKQLIQALDDANIVRTLAKVIRTSAERKIPIAATPSTATWVLENGVIPESTVTFSQKTLDAFKLTDLIKVSVELLQDSMFDISSYLAQEFARAFGAEEERAFCIGAGTTEPTGIFTANGGALGITTPSATNITFDDIISLIYSLKTPYRRNAVFLLHDATIGVLRKLKDSNGQFLWQPSLQQGQPDMLFGYPAYTTPYAPVVASGAFTVAFGDMSNYWIGDRMGRSVQRLNELYAGNGQVGFLAIERVDGKMILSEGVKLLKMA